MGKIIKYTFHAGQVNDGTEQQPEMRQIFHQKTLPWNERNEEIAKREAYFGAYSVVDDGQPDTITTDDVLNTLLGVRI